ncbi:MAG: hypothetical protein WBB23_18710 [Desulforhopalus sp.]
MKPYHVTRTSSDCRVRKPLSLIATKNAHLHDVVLFLRQKELVHWVPGYSFKCSVSTRGAFATSKIWPTYKFDEVFVPLKDDNLCNYHVTFSDSALIRMKHDGRYVELSPTDKVRTQGMANKLKRINSVNMKHHIVVKSSGCEYPCCNKLFIAFANNLERGGRIYAFGNSYQNDLRENRKKIFIENEATIELDYSGLHPRMLYAKEGIQYNGELYDLNGYLTEFQEDPDLKLLAKRALLILINAKYSRNIPGTLADNIWKNDRRLSRQLYKRYPPSDSDLGIYSRVVEAVKTKHEAISKYFHSDSGAKLQRIDGKIALAICYWFACCNIPILPVHDSFIVALQHSKQLQNLMYETYQRYNQGFSCPVKQK